MPDASTQTELADLVETLPQHQQFYRSRAAEIKRNTASSIGYPIMRPTYGYFTDLGWVKTYGTKKLIDTSGLGIKPDSPADTLMINIGLIDPEGQAERSGA